ncbi:MAG TPA: hypothetical protein VHV57_15840 [Acidimicrobiales bacterium]|jgi:hypothetical protein|nr:hypothetical protein [Acidimicrobiales bacterium]
MTTPEDPRQHHHDAARPEADALEQEMPVVTEPVALVPDADRVEPLDDAEASLGDDLDLHRG